MRILLLSFILALPMATIASAEDGDTATHEPSDTASHGALGRRTIGLGIGQDLGYVGIGDGASLVDETSLRWQPSARFALEPNVRFGARGSGRDSGTSKSQAMRLGTRLRVTAASRGSMHLVGLLGVAGSLSNATEASQFTGEQQYTSVFAAASTGFGIEYAPKRWWGLGADYRLVLVEASRTTFGGNIDQDPQNDWRIGPTDSGRIVATAHVYF